MKRIIIVLLFFSSFSINFSQEKTTSEVNNWDSHTYYVKFNRLNIRKKPSSKSKIVGAFSLYQKIIVIEDDQNFGNWKQAIYPTEGFVFGKYLIPENEFSIRNVSISKKVKLKNDFTPKSIEFPEAEFTIENKEKYDFNLEDVDKYLIIEKNNSSEIIYPIKAKFAETNEEYSELLPTESISPNWTFEEKHVRAYFLNLREKPSQHGKIITALKKNEKILCVDEQEVKITRGWVKVVYPKEGFVYKKYLFNREVKDSTQLKNNWHAEKKLSNQNVQLYSDSTFSQRKIILPANQKYLAILDSTKTIRVVFPQTGFVDFKYEPKIESEEKTILIKPEFGIEERYVSASFLNVRKSASENGEIINQVRQYEKVLLIVNDEKITPGWRRVVFPFDGFLYEKYLLDFKDENKLSDELNIIQNNWEPMFVDNINDSVIVFATPVENSEHAGKIYKDEKIVLIIDSTNYEDGNFPEWTQIVYPLNGYLISEDFFEPPSFNLISLGFLYGVYQLPIELNLENYSNPIGGILEYSRTNWRFAFRIGYFQTKTNLNDYILSTQHILLTIRYSYLRFFDDNLDFYIGAGGNYWMSKFQFIKYPSLEDYFPEEKDQDFGYTLSTGFVINYANFFLDLQYYFWNSREGIFGPDPVPGEFTNQYKIFPGSNQANLILGYRLKF